jgi:hypothetical protein
MLISIPSSIDLPSQAIETHAESVAQLLVP